MGLKCSRPFSSFATDLLAHFAELLIRPAQIKILAMSLRGLGTPEFTPEAFPSIFH